MPADFVTGSHASGQTIKPTFGSKLLPLYLRNHKEYKITYLSKAHRMTTKIKAKGILSRRSRGLG